MTQPGGVPPITHSGGLSMFWKTVKRAVAAADRRGRAGRRYCGVSHKTRRRPPLPAVQGPRGTGTRPPRPSCRYRTARRPTLSGMSVGGGCSSCGGGVIGCTDCMNAPVGCGEGGCYPGRDGCCPITGRGPITRLYAAYQNALCCPDPCYVPQWRCRGERRPVRGPRPRRPP